MPPSAPKPQRLLSLDVFRGATIAAMMLVNNPGDWSAVYKPLEHAEWQGWTFTDLVFPFFRGLSAWRFRSTARRRRDKAAANYSGTPCAGRRFFLGPWPIPECVLVLH